MHTNHHNDTLEIKDFTVQHWVEDELIVYEDVIAIHNPSGNVEFLWNSCYFSCLQQWPQVGISALCIGHPLVPRLHMAP